MTNDDNRSARERALRNIAAARASRVPVDHNGRPTTKPRTYTYDNSSRLIAVDVPPEDKQ